jgi:hypothetical protein
MSSPKYQPQLITAGNIIPELHYGPFAVNWWTLFNPKISKNKNLSYIPIRVNMRIQIILNKTKFIIHTICDMSNTMQPGYVCENDVDGQIHLTASEAINKVYKKFFNTETRFPGPSIMGFDNENIVEQLLHGVTFQPFKIQVDNLSIFISKLGATSTENENSIQSGYQSSFISKFRGKQCLFVQQINDNGYKIDIFHKNEKIASYNNISLNEVWVNTGVLKKYNGETLFGIHHPVTINSIKKNNGPICYVTDWNNKDLLTSAFEQHLKRRISGINLDWYRFFIQWKEQPSSIIEFKTHLKTIYPSDYIFNDRELRAWRAMLRSVGCTNITPFKNDELKVRL